MNKVFLSFLATVGPLVVSALPGMAATLDYQVTLEYQSEAFTGVFVQERTLVDEQYDDWAYVTIFSGEMIEGADNIYGMQGPYTDKAPGHRVAWSFSIDLDSTLDGGFYYELASCSFGSLGCRDQSYAPTRPPSEDGLWGTHTSSGTSGSEEGYRAEDIIVGGDLNIGGSVEARLLYVNGGGVESGGGGAPFYSFYEDYRARFTVAEVTISCPDPGAYPDLSYTPYGCTPLSEAPVPATLSLMATGLGLLAVTLGWRNRARRAGGDAPSATS